MYVVNPSNQPGRTHESLRFLRVAIILRSAQSSVNKNFPPSTHPSIRALKLMKIENTAYNVGQGIEDNRHRRIRQKSRKGELLISQTLTALPLAYAIRRRPLSSTTSPFSPPSFPQPDVHNPRTHHTTTTYTRSNRTKARKVS